MNCDIIQDNVQNIHPDRLKNINYHNNNASNKGKKNNKKLYNTYI